MQPWTWEDAVRFGKTILAVVGAAALLAALVGVASAGRLSASANTVNSTWARISFRGGLGTVECEVIVNGTFHSRTITKTPLLLTGLITAANINRCARGGATVLRETLPWHVRYSSFTGTLPAIASIQARVVGLSFRAAEPVFGVECLVRATAETPGLISFNLERGVTVSATAGGTIRCGGAITAMLEGNTTSIAEAGGARVTVTLI
jgi:hypothetical protein